MFNTVSVWAFRDYLYLLEGVEYESENVKKLHVKHFAFKKEKQFLKMTKEIERFATLRSPGKNNAPYLTRVLLSLPQSLYGKADTGLHTAKGIRQVLNLILRFDFLYFNVYIT